MLHGTRGIEMKENIGVELLRSGKVNAREKAFEIYDTKLKGFTLKIYPDTVSKKGDIIPGAKTYLVRYRLPDGRQTRTVIGRHTLFTPTQARDKAEKILRAVKDGTVPNDSKQQVNTFSEYLEKVYSPWLLENLKTGEQTAARLKTCFPDLLESKLDEISPRVIEQWRTGKLKSGLSPASINRDLANLRAALSRAVEWEYIPTHPLANKVKPLKIDKNPIIRFLDGKEEPRLLAALDTREATFRSERDSANEWRRARGYALLPDLKEVTYVDHLKPMVILSLNTGMRRGEVFSLRWSDIDFKRKIATVRGEEAKSSVTRHIPLNTLAHAALKSWRKQTEGDVVFPGKKNEQLNNTKRSWQSLLKLAKIEQFRWHDMRHHFASKLVMAGVDLNTVRELLGHSDLKMTLRYAHLAPEHKAAAVNLLVTTGPPEQS